MLQCFAEDVTNLPVGWFHLSDGKSRPSSSESAKNLIIAKIGAGSGCSLQSLVSSHFSHQQKNITHQEAEREGEEGGARGSSGWGQSSGSSL